MHSTVRRSLVRVEGVHLHCVEIGEGPPLVLLHGLSDSHRSWGLVAPALARSRRVLIPDLPGHGLSDRPDASYELAWHAHILGAWIDTLGYDQIDLAGHSFGGGVAQWLLLSHRARVRRLALVAPGGLGREVAMALRLGTIGRIVERFGQPFMGTGTRLGVRAARSAYDADDVDHLSWANTMPGSARALSRTVRDIADWRGQRRHFIDRAHEVGELPPIALFWGDRDPVVPFAHAIEAASLIERASLTRFERCGHYPHREQPERFTGALEAFFDAPHAMPARIRRRLPPAPVSPRPSVWRRAWSAIAAGARRLFGQAYLE